MVKKADDASANAVEIAQSQLGAVELTEEQLVVVSTLQDRIDDRDLRNITSFEDALGLAEAINGAVLDITEHLGTGFAVLDNKDKSKLVETELILVQWRFYAGDYGAFASAAIVTRNGEKFIVNDGSTGIYKQLKEFSSEHKIFGGLRVPNGLRESEYDTCPECGVPMTKDMVDCVNERCDYGGEKRSIGRTYYLDLTPAAN